MSPNPSFSGDQRPPASRLRYTPPSQVPANTIRVFLGFTANALTYKCASPVLTGFQVLPASVLFITPRYFVPK